MCALPNNGDYMRILLALVILVGISNCGTESAKTEPKEEGVASIPLEATFNSIHEQILLPKCVGCHSPGQAAKRVPLNTREDLINSPRDLVIPGNPAESGLFLAVTRTDQKRMPPATVSIEPLLKKEVEVIRQWILEGAQ